MADPFGKVTELPGMAVNDSGVAVAAMAYSVLLPYVTYLVARATCERRNHARRL